MNNLVTSYEIEFEKGVKSTLFVYQTKNNTFYCRYGKYCKYSLGPCYDLKTLLHRFLRSQSANMAPVFEKDLQFWINASSVEPDGVVTMKVFSLSDGFIGVINCYGKVIESTDPFDDLRELIFALYAKLLYLYYKVDDYE